MSRGRSWSRIRSKNKAVAPWLAAALMTLLGALTGAAPAVASTGTAGTAIRSAACTSARANWVHITFTAPSRTTICYGGTGTITFSANDVSKFCPGNNDGAFTYMNIATGQDHTDNFEPGGATLRFSPEVDAVSLKIDSFSGNHHC